ncbi:MAG: DUF4382 domain-containing protein [Terriglobales bacterium]|jgi:hypothetical protein
MKRTFAIVCTLALTALTLACGGGTSTTSGGSASSQGQVFVTGEDAPLPSVVSFNITINSITLQNSSTQVTALSTPTTVDFGRLVGLRSLLGFNTVPAGSYTSATFNLANPVISYVDMTQNPPALTQLNGTLTTSTVTVAFPQAMVVTSNGLGGLHMDFDLRQSLETNTNGQITGTVNPTIDIMAVSASQEEGQVTEYTGNVVSTNASANNFTMQGPYGFQEVIDVNSSTKFNSGYSITTIPSNSIVCVEGTVQDDGSILAQDVEVITTDKAFISGRVLQVNPSTGPVQTVTMFVGEELGADTVIPVDSVQTINLSGITQYDVCFFDNWFTNFLFNSSNLVVGQRIFVGGTVASGAFTPSMVSLRRQGTIGTVVANSVNSVSGNLGDFELSNDGLLEFSANGPFTVQTGNLTLFLNVDGLSGLQTAGTANVLARGIVLKDQTTGLPQMWAHRVRIMP